MCVREQERACTRLHRDRRIIWLLFMENSVRTHAPLWETPGGTPPSVVPLPTRHTPRSWAGGGHFNPDPHPTRLLSPPSLLQRLGPCRRTPSLGRRNRVGARFRPAPGHALLSKARSARTPGAWLQFPAPAPPPRAGAKERRRRRGRVVLCPRPRPTAPIAAFPIFFAPQRGSRPPKLNTPGPRRAQVAVTGTYLGPQRREYRASTSALSAEWAPRGSRACGPCQRRRLFPSGSGFQGCSRADTPLPRLHPPPLPRSPPR